MALKKNPTQEYRKQVHLFSWIFSVRNIYQIIMDSPHMKIMTPRPPGRMYQGFTLRIARMTALKSSPLNTLYSVSANTSIRKAVLAIFFFLLVTLPLLSCLFFPACQSFPCTASRIPASGRGKPAYGMPASKSVRLWQFLQTHL